MKPWKSSRQKESFNLTYFNASPALGHKLVLLEIIALAMVDNEPLLLFLLVAFVFVGAILLVAKKDARRQKDLDQAFKRSKSLQQRQGR